MKDLRVSPGHLNTKQEGYQKRSPEGLTIGKLKNLICLYFQQQNMPFWNVG